MNARLSALRISISSALVLSLMHVSLYGQTPLPMMPLPAHSTLGSGSFVVSGSLRVVFQGYTEPRLDRARQRFLETLAHTTGIPQWPEPSVKQGAFTIRTAGPSAAVQHASEDESYRLNVASSGVTLEAPTPLGVLYGLQTFLQLVTLTSQGFVVPAVNIEDKPRFAWRGLMVDSGRHFIPIDVLHQTLDGMEAVKLNVFHWHLSEDQGFRLESKDFPLLTAKGSDGLYYSQTQAKELVEYARDRGIRVIPEFDMPGHATSWFVGYPELASGKGPYQIERKWGVFDPAMDPTRESTYKFLDIFIGEMSSLFPDAYFHIGGDECNGKEWDANPRIQTYMREHDLKTNEALQAYFTTRVQELVTKHHKITIGWDEILQPNTPKNVMIQSWRGQDSVADAARRGYNVILSSGYYIDLNEPASQHYAIDPLGKAASTLSVQEQTHVLGGEATMWSEFVSPENVEGRIWPRMAAIAERLWSPQDVTDTKSMYERLALVSQTLTWHGIPYLASREEMLRRIAGDGDLSPLKVLASVVEPPKGYARGELKPYSSATPLNLLVDAVPSESDQARRFRELADRIADGSATPADRRQAREWLMVWRDNEAVLQPTLAGSALAAELVPVSHGLHESSVIGLAALDAIEKAAPPTATDRAEQLATLKTLEAPQAALLLAIVPGVESLVNAEEKSSQRH